MNKPKYYINDTVWFMYANKAMSGEISTIHIEKTQHIPSFLVDITYTIYDSRFDGDISCKCTFKENQLYSTKEEPLKSL